MNPLYVALDVTDALQARQMAETLRGVIGGLKIGLTCWYANGPATISTIVAGFDWFLDLKLHDIPTQVAGAVRAVLPLRPTLISIHEAGGPAMMEAAVLAAQASVPRPKILAVTTLTSLSATPQQIAAQAQRALACGVDGVITSPRELRLLRDTIGPEPILLTPGIRLGGDASDHQRTATPRQALNDGATFLVVGRPITQAVNPRDVAKSILASSP